MRPVKTNVPPLATMDTLEIQLHIHVDRTEHFQQQVSPILAKLTLFETVPGIFVDFVFGVLVSPKINNVGFGAW